MTKETLALINSTKDKVLTATPEEQAQLQTLIMLAQLALLGALVEEGGTGE